MSNKKNKLIPVIDITNNKMYGKIKLSEVNDFYKKMRAKNIGVNVDNDGDIFIDREDPDDGGLLYQEQLDY